MTIDRRQRQDSGLPYNIPYSDLTGNSWKPEEGVVQEPTFVAGCGIDPKDCLLRGVLIGRFGRECKHNNNGRRKGYIPVCGFSPKS